MFTGLISAIGEISAVEKGRTAQRFTIDCEYDPAGIALGASIAHDGCCLTVTEVRAHEHGSRYDVEVSEETLRVTALGHWSIGTRVNLERSLRLGDELGGHLVTGHVDGVGVLESRVEEAGSWQMRFAAPQALMGFIARKGSIAVQGVSLTVNEATRDRFAVNIIPHTADHTTLGAMDAGARVNLEVDLIARYIQRQREFAETTT